MLWFDATAVASVAHRIDGVMGDNASPRVALTMWFTASAAHKEIEADNGYGRRQGSKCHVHHAAAGATVGSHTPKKARSRM